MKTLIAAALILASSFASAHEVDADAALSIKGTEVATIYSEVGEGRTEFVKRASKAFVEYTDKTGHEVCSQVAVLKDGADGVRPTFSMKMMTVGSQIACVTLPSDTAEGYVSMGTTAHSHPDKRVLRLTKLDMKLRGKTDGKLRTETLNTCKFSEQDFVASGFLFACGKVQYQSGKGTEKEI